MIRTRTIVSIIALSAMAAACSGGGSGEKGAEEAMTAETPAAPAGAPAPTDVATLDGVQYASLTGNAAAGKLVFAQCGSCHVTDPGVNKTGPSLAGLIGRKSGSVAGYNYSAANANSGFIWTKEKLFQYLEKPGRVIPQTKMIYPGIPDAQKRADVIAYLENPS
jgi:cytochrome c